MFTMVRSRNSLKRPLWVVACIFGVCLVTVTSGQTVGLVSHACVRTTTMTQNEPQGIRFIVSENDCDTFGNSVYSTIFASDAQGHHRVPLIEFGPDERSAPPMISVNDMTIVIAIESVEDLVFQKPAYGSYKVFYHIGRVVYPNPKPK
jgi:hypothetical protein